jgi:hypothetical protein
MVGLWALGHFGGPAEVRATRDSKPYHGYDRNKRLGGAPFVAMMQTTDLWKRDNLTGIG